MSLYFVFVIALVLYTLSIWVHKITGTSKVWVILVFGIALATDAFGTIFLCFRETENFSFSVHSISGITALAVMTLHFMWALLARSRPQYKAYFDKWSPWAWGLWMVAFMTPAIPYMM